MLAAGPPLMPWAVREPTRHGVPLAFILLKAHEIVHGGSLEFNGTFNTILPLKK